MAKVSILIPSNNERYAKQTIEDLLKHATGDIEIILVLDGAWPDPPIDDDKRVHVVHWGEGRGMRPCINAAARLAKGDFLMKLDAHCSVSPGFDEVLKADYPENNWIVVPRRGSLDAANWCKLENNKAPVDAHFLSYPFEQGRPGAGLHGQVWVERARALAGDQLSEEMSSQGSCWFMSRRHWKRLGEMSVEGYGQFVSEFQELGCKTWLGGGKVMVNKKTTYLHWHKGKEGRGYFIDKRQMDRGHRFTNWYWMTNQWKDRQHDLSWLVERFDHAVEGLPIPGWPRVNGAIDWAEVGARTAEYSAEYARSSGAA